MSTQQHLSADEAAILTSVDSTMMEAIERASIPTYVVRDLIHSGEFVEVQNAVLAKRAHLQRPITVAEMTFILEQAISEVTARDVHPVDATSKQQDAPSRVRFIEPDEPEPEAPETVDGPAGWTPHTITLIRLELLLNKWRQGAASSSDTVDAVARILGAPLAPRATDGAPTNAPSGTTTTPSTPAMVNPPLGS